MRSLSGKELEKMKQEDYEAYFYYMHPEIEAEEAYDKRHQIVRPDDYEEKLKKEDRKRHTKEKRKKEEAWENKVHKPKPFWKLW